MHAKQTVIWRQIGLEVPAAWEMLLFGTGATEGRCLFADRYEHRLELRWRAVAGVPDVQRMADDYAALLQTDARMRETKRTAVPPWLGVIYRTDNIHGSRFVRWLEELRLVVEMTFLWPETPAAELEKAVLCSVRSDLSDATGRQRWRAFGLDCLAGPGLELRTCVAQPGRALFHFTDPHHHGPEEQYERLGMVEDWLKRPVAEWLEARLSGAVAIRDRHQGELRGHNIVGIRGTRPVPGLARLWGRRLHVTTAAWICPVDGRLYLARTDRPTPTTDTLAGVRLTCCDAWTQGAE